MQLSMLLDGLVVVPDAKDVFITGLSEFSGDVEQGDVFLATSGLEYAAEAVAHGARAIICEARYLTADAMQDRSVPVIALENLASQISEIASRFYNPEKYTLKTIAITGTDGKSSVAHLVTQALEKSGEPCGLIGTLGYGRLNNLSVANHTTPPVTRLYKEYDKCLAQDCYTIALEASSHGIDQNRLQSLPIYTAVLTNITRDHLDYHNTIEEYIKAKAKLFFHHQPKYAVINIDDTTGRQWCEQLAVTTNLITYSLANDKADVYASEVRYLQNGTSIALNIRGEQTSIFVSLLGEFNVLNVLAVTAVLLSLDKSTQEITACLKHISAVPGRMQRVSRSDQINVIIDYAHTPAALFAAIHAAREHCTGKLICIFGCGGDRDTGKRSQMGEIASQYADLIVITSDNPRSEAPQEIIDDIVGGCLPDSDYITIIDRQEAITYALTKARLEDAVLIAGKGHEQYQIIGDQKIKFDDAQIAVTELNRGQYG